MKDPAAFDPEKPRRYPYALWLREKLFLDARRAAVHAADEAEGEGNETSDEPHTDTIGIGLSGGGIRSATFCLGVLQALSRQQLLRRFDYLSTVSGGGYIGSFLTRLFARARKHPHLVNGPEDVERIMTGDAGHGRTIIEYLRRFSRYLSPNGSGDVWLGMAIILRNIVGIQIVMAIFILMILLIAHAFRRILEFSAWAPYRDWLVAPLEAIGGTTVWISPWVVIPAGVFVLGVLPQGWAYWIVERYGNAHGGRQRFRLHPVFGLLMAATLGFGLVMHVVPARGPWVAGPVIMGLLSLALAFTFGRANQAGWDKLQRPLIFTGCVYLILALLIGAGWGRLGARLNGDWGAGLWFGRELFAAQLTFGALLAVIASMAMVQLAWALWDTPRKASGSDAGYGEVTGVPTVRNLLSRRLATGIQWTLFGAIAVAIDSLGQSIYLGLQLGYDFPTLISAGGATIGSLAAGAARLIQRFNARRADQRPSIPVKLLATVAALLLGGVILFFIDLLSHALSWGLAMPGYAPRWPTAENLPMLPATVGVFEVALALIMAAVALFFTLFMSRVWTFLNRSSLHAFYSARLKRAYLGASNPQRQPKLEAKASDAAPTRLGVIAKGDDIWLSRLWEDPAKMAGAPLHLINVTINQTYSERFGTQHPDLKGMAMAVGPGGYSVAVGHHAIMDWERDERRPQSSTGIFKTKFGRLGAIGLEPLTLGYWAGISGAAFSTGTGYRTSFGLSLLAGMLNIRLGYWWSTGPSGDDDSRAIGEFLENKIIRWFPVVGYLIGEFLARFPGVARPHWYLSDGGHFENLGGYELIRRRIPKIVLIDAEADPDYTFQGLATLVRRSRVDLGAKIEFLDRAQIGRLRQRMPAPCREWIGVLADLRRGDWPKPADADDWPELKTSDRTGRSRAHAAIARVTYDDEPGRESWILYIKPTVIGDESVDIGHYHAKQPDFPQQTTIDQFFDEEQWEAYRELGERIGCVLFTCDQTVPHDGKTAGTGAGPATGGAVTGGGTEAGGGAATGGAEATGANHVWSPAAWLRGEAELDLDVVGGEVTPAGPPAPRSVSSPEPAPEPEPEPQPGPSPEPGPKGNSCPLV